jgi:hypothetical protein
MQRILRNKQASRGTRRLVYAIAVVGSVVLGSGLAVAAAPVTGSVSGPVTSVKGQTFQLTTSLSPTGSSTIQVSSKTMINEQASGSRADLRRGVCIAALGQKDGKGVVAATRIMISQPFRGQCGGGFGQRGRRNGSRPRANGSPPQGSTTPRRPPGGTGGFANLGFANGAISAIKGSAITVHNQRGSTSVTVSAKTQVLKTISVGGSAIKVKLCAFVRGTSTDKGVTVAAQSISLSNPGPNGCNSRFRGP